MKHTFDHHPGFNKVVLLFRGMFRDPGFGRILAAAFDGTRRPLEVVTVIADPQFDFPSVDVYETETKAFPVQWWHVDDDDDDDDDGGELGLFRWMYAKRHRIYALGFSVHFFELQNVTWAVLKKPGWSFYWALIWGLFHIPSRIRLLRSRISWFMSVDFVSTLMSKQRQEDDFNLFSDEQLGSVNLESFPPVGCSFWITTWNLLGWKWCH